MTAPSPRPTFFSRKLQFLEDSIEELQEKCLKNQNLAEENRLNEQNDVEIAKNWIFDREIVEDEIRQELEFLEKKCDKNEQEIAGIHVEMLKKSQKIKNINCRMQRIEEMSGKIQNSKSSETIENGLERLENLENSQKVDRDTVDKIRKSVMELIIKIKGIQGGKEATESPSIYENLAAEVDSLHAFEDTVGHRLCDLRGHLEEIDGYVRQMYFDMEEQKAKNKSLQSENRTLRMEMTELKLHVSKEFETLRKEILELKEQKLDSAHNSECPDLMENRIKATTPKIGPQKMPVRNAIVGQWKLISAENVLQYHEKTNYSNPKTQENHLKIMISEEKLSILFKNENGDFVDWKHFLADNSDNFGNYWRQENGEVITVEYRDGGQTETTRRKVKNGVLEVKNEMGGAECLKIYERVF